NSMLEELASEAKSLTQKSAVKTCCGDIATAVQVHCGAPLFPTKRAPVDRKARSEDSLEGVLPIDGRSSSLTLSIFSSGLDTNPAATKNFKFLIASDREGVLMASRIKDVSNFFLSSDSTAACLLFSSSRVPLAFSSSICSEVSDFPLSMF